MSWLIVFTGELTRKGSFRSARWSPFTKLFRSHSPLGHLLGKHMILGDIFKIHMSKSSRTKAIELACRSTTLQNASLCFYFIFHVLTIRGLYLPASKPVSSLELVPNVPSAALLELRRSRVWHPKIQLLRYWFWLFSRKTQKNLWSSL